MTIILELLRYNHIIASVISLIGNGILLYLIITVKNSSVKRFTIVLLPNSLMDSLAAIVTIMTQPQTFVIEKRSYLVIGSPLSELGYHAACVIMWTYASTVITSMNAVCIPFYIRYLVICKNVQISFRHVLQPYGILALTFIINFGGMRWCYPTNFDTYQKYKGALMTDFWLEEYKNGPTFVATEIDVASFFIPYSFIIASTSFSYSMIIYFSYKIVKTLHSHVSNYEGTKLLSRQLHKTLIIQAIGPFLIGNIPIISLIAMFFLKVENLNIPLAFSFFLGWIAVVNPIAAILIIGPYRQRIKKILGIKEKQQNQQHQFNVSITPNPIAFISDSSHNFYRTSI